MEHPRADQVPRKVRRAKHSVGLHVKTQFFISEDFQEFPDARVHERLAAGELYGLKAQWLCLIENVPE
jgi:hypothetical protein